MQRWLVCYLAAATDCMHATRCEFRVTRCDVVVNNRLFGDPCVLTPKYLEVQYWCETGKQLPRFEQSTFIQLPACTDNVALPAFASRCCCVPGSSRSISPARRTHSSKPAATRSSGFAAVGSPYAGTARRTDGRTPDRYIDPGPHSMQAVPIIAQHCCE